MSSSLDSVAETTGSCIPVSFMSVRPLLAFGWRKTMMTSDMPRLPKEESFVADVTLRLEATWKVECRGKKKPSLLRALKVAFRKDMWLAMVNGILWVLFLVAQALVLRPLVDSLGENGGVVAAIGWGALFVGFAMMTVVALHRHFWYVMTVGWNWKICAISLLHKKLLKTTTSAIAEVSTGHALALMTSDAVRFDQLIPYFAPHNSFVAIIFAFGVMIYDLGVVAAVVGLAVLLVSVFVQFRLGKGFESLRRLTATATDARVKLTGEVLSSAHSVKTCGWERAFEKAIAKKRQVEADAIRRSQVLRALSLGTYFASIPIAACAAFSTHAALETPDSSNLSVGTTSSVIALLTVARTFLYLLSRYSMSIPEIDVACQRMGDFLLLKEVDEKDKETSSAKKGDQGDGCLLRLEKSSFAWPSSKKVALRSVDLEVRPGELVCVVGETGCGKSALLHSCLGELDLIEGTREIQARAIAFSPQRPWNVSGTVRENVVLAGDADKAVDEDAYRDALSSAALDADIKLWEDGDNTMVGEKGLTLSGGQAARLALARCVYAASVGRAQIALLDDPLSAVDAKVAEHLVETCLKKRLCSDLQVGVLLATHQRQFLSHATRVVVIASDGRAVANAPLADILDRGGIAADLLGGSNAATITAPPPGEDDGVVKEEVIISKKDDELKESDDNETTDESLEEKKKKSQYQVTTKEDRNVGAISMRTWSEFIGAGGGGLVVVVLSMFVAAQALLMYSDVLLLRWSDRKKHRLTSDIYRNYVLLVMAACLLGALRGVLFFTATLRAATSLHSRAIQRVLHAPLSWIQANPFGRIINRFSSDLAQTDDLLSITLLEFATLAFLMLGSVFFACASVPPLILLVPIVTYAGFQSKKFTSKTMNELKRLDGVTRSDVLSVVAASLHGLSPIRAFGCEKIQTVHLEKALCANAKAYFFWFCCNRYLGFVLDSYAVVFITVLVAVAVAMKNIIDPTLLAIALIYCTQLLAYAQYSVRMFAQCEQFLTSVERLLAYVRLKDVESSTDDDTTTAKRKMLKADENDDVESGQRKGPPDQWPSSGSIEVVDLEYRYRIDAPLVLKGVSMFFPARSKTGLCGRTGSGKSSTIAALSRLHDVCGGRVVIDGVDVANIPLPRLRAAIAVIPQSPALFSGTVRFNVDPKGDRSDDEILGALDEARLLRKWTNSEAILDTPVEEGGQNWSTGESQLLCLARALVLKRTICCFDEATANVDFETDAHIQATLRNAEAFKSATLIVIAHRIRTILDADHIVLLKDGLVLETGSPKDLLEATPESNFATMVKASHLTTTTTS